MEVKSEPSHFSVTAVTPSSTLIVLMICELKPLPEYELQLLI